METVQPSPPLELLQPLEPLESPLQPSPLDELSPLQPSPLLDDELSPLHESLLSDESPLQPLPSDDPVHDTPTSTLLSAGCSP